MRSLLDIAIERAYAAAAGEVSWQDALAAATRAFDAQGAMLLTPEVAADAGGLSVSHDASGERRPLRAVSGQEAMPQPTNRAYSTSLGDPRDSRMPATLFVLFRSESAPPLNAEERGKVDIFSSHLSRAVGVWFQGRSTRSGADVLASSLQVGALVADSEARITWKNPRADAWIRDGRLVVSNAKVLGATGFSIDLPRLVREIASRSDGATLALGKDATLEIVSVAGSRALLLLRDHSSCKQVAASLAANFRLTSTEVDLAVALWKGILIGEYATQRSVAMSTVRTQLKSLLAKLRARRQSDVVSIVARLASLASPVMADPAIPRMDDDDRRRVQHDP